MEVKTTDWDRNIEADPGEEYEALARSLEWTEGFGLFFVLCSPAKGQELIGNLKRDLAQKRITILELSERTDNLYDLVAEISDRFDIAIVRGLEESFKDYIKPGYGGEGDYYKLDSVPRVLGNLNLQRERFRDELNICLVFFLPLFGLKYFIRRAPDFYDWRSGTFEFLTDDERVGEEVKKMMEGALILYKKLDKKNNLDLTFKQLVTRVKYLHDCLQDTNRNHDVMNRAVKHIFEWFLMSYKGNLKERENTYDNLQSYSRILYILGRYEEAVASCDRCLKIQTDNVEVLYIRGLALYELGQYEEAIYSYDLALEYEPFFCEIWYDRGLSLLVFGDNLEALNSFLKALEICPDYNRALYMSSILYSCLNELDKALNMLEKAIAIEPQYRKLAATDTDFEPLRDRPEFQRLLNDNES